MLSWDDQLAGNQLSRHNVHGDPGLRFRRSFHSRCLSGAGARSIARLARPCVWSILLMFTCTPELLTVTFFLLSSIQRSDEDWCLLAFLLTIGRRLVFACFPFFFFDHLEGELTALRDILAKNGYPGELLDWFVTTDQPSRREGPRPCPLTLRVPWLGSKTEKLVRRANDAVRLAYPAGEVRAVYRTNKAFNLPKDRIPTQSQSNLIYQFECRQCGSRYVGKTAQRFADRISQHVPKHVLAAVLDPQRKRPGRPPKKRENHAEGYQSAVACHLAANADCCRSYRESHFTVLSRCRSKQHRDVLEAMYIFVVLSQCYVDRNHLL